MSSSGIISKGKESTCKTQMRVKSSSAMFRSIYEHVLQRQRANKAGPLQAKSVCFYQNHIPRPTHLDSECRILSTLSDPDWRGKNSLVGRFLPPRLSRKINQCELQKIRHSVLSKSNQFNNLKCDRRIKRIGVDACRACPRVVTKAQRIMHL